MLYVFILFVFILGACLIVFAGTSAGSSFTEVSSPKTEYARGEGIRGILLSLAMLFTGLLLLLSGSIGITANQAQPTPGEILAAAPTNHTLVVLAIGMIVYFLLASSVMKAEMQKKIRDKD